MNRKLITVALVSGLSFSVYMVSGGSVTAQTDFLTDAGIAPNRDATCPVRLDEDFAADAGLKLYQRLKFPVRLTTLSDGGRDVQMPPMPIAVMRNAIEVVDWSDCTLNASTGPVAALWGTQRPFLLTGVVKPWCRAKEDAGLPCLRVLPDGGSASFGNRNVYPCANAVNPSTCERASSGVVYSGDNDEDL
jgi:hypothetical protein